MIKRRTKNSTVSAALISTSTGASIDPPPKNTTIHSLPQLSRSNQPTMTSNTVAFSPLPEPSSYQSNPEDEKSFHSFTHSASQQSRFPTVVSPDSAQSQGTRYGIRKSRQVPAFKLMVLGAKMTGKSTFLNTLLSTLTPSLPTTDPPPSISIRPTSRLSEKQLLITTLSGEKIMLNVVDTPGLDIHSHDEFRVDLQVNEALHYIESKFDDSLHIERQVHRNPTKLGDSHVHVAIYFIDPSTILRERMPTISSKCNGGSSVAHEDTNELHMSAIDLRQLKRLSRRCNILPIIGRSDELTETELSNLKQIVRSDIESYGIDLGLFTNNESEAEFLEEERSKPPTEMSGVKTAAIEVKTESVSSHNASESETPKSLPRRKSTALIAPRRPFSYVMDSLQEFENVCGMIPLSLIGSEVIPGQSMEADQIEKLNQVNPFFNPPNNDLASNFVRRFKWAVVDVLNPHHCDFVLLRAVVLGSHFKRLKEATRLEKYEKYRTEKLLARRLTMDKGLLGLEEQKRIAIEVDRMQIPHIEPTVSIFATPATSVDSAKMPVTSHSKTSFRSPTSWRNKLSSPPYSSQPNIYQSSGANRSTTDENYRQSHLAPHSHPENVNNNVPMVF